MSSDSVVQMGFFRPIRVRLRRLLGPGGAGDQIIFGYMFRIIYSVAAVIVASAVTVSWIIAFDAPFSGTLFWLFCFGSLLIMAIGESLRRKVYESYSTKRGNILTDQDSATSALAFADFEEHLHKFSWTGLPRSARIKKRALDLAVSIGALVALAPLFLIVALLIKFDSSGPILVRQIRIGARGQTFEMLKFRTITNSIPLGQKNLALSDEEEKLGGLITTVGRFLRRTSIDELPQLFNVILGQMSIVGPRPLSLKLNDRESFQTDNFQIFIEKYFDIKPGLTGLALSDESYSHKLSDPHYFAYQSFEELIERRNYYIGDWSILRDVCIIFRTACFLARHSD